MPSDSNGNYALPAGYLAVAGETILPSEHNPPLEDIASGLTARLMRSGAGGMTGPLKLSDGAVGAPGLTFGTALTTGFYKTSSGFGIAISGTLVAEFGAGGLLSGVQTVAINDQAVTYPKMVAPSAASRLLGSNANAALTITGAANNGSGLIRLTVASTSTFSTGQKKIVAGVTGTTEANGRWTITVVDATHIDLQASTFTNAWVSGGTIGGGVDEIKISSGLLLSGDTLTATLNPTLIPNYLSGLTLSTGGGSAIFGIAAGVANDSTNATLMALGSAITKTTASWAVGTGNGALDTGSIATGTWYHVYLIERPDTGVVDVIISLSASAPALPANYTLYRRIGSIKTTGGANVWQKFVQVGDLFLWDTMVNDISISGLSTTAVLSTLTTPLGIQTTALIRGTMQNASSSIYVVISSPSESDQAASASTASISNPVAGVNASGSFEVLTNTSSQIRTRANASSTTLNMSTYGWKDNRGRLG